MNNRSRTAAVRTFVAALALTAIVRGQGPPDAVPVGRPAPPAGRVQRTPAPGAEPGVTPQKPAIRDVKAVRSCESLVDVALPNTRVESAAIDPDDSNICRLTVVKTHPPAGDAVRIWIAVPLSNWNGRFLGNGGGGFSGGNPASVIQPAASGYAAGATDTGHEGGSGSFALDSHGRLNWELIRDNAHVGIHEMTATGKALVQTLYGVAPRYSYFNGCSTGGRQGLMEAQRYPQDYNGIVAGAPAINWQKLHPQQMWGSVIMNAAGNPIPTCKLAAATAAAVAACDTIDSVRDGILEDPKRCTYDPRALVGTSADDCGTFTQTDADLIRKLWEGPHREAGSALWYGLPRGADLTALWNSRGTPLKPEPFGITLDWFRYFLTANPQFDWTTITPAAYEQLFDQSVEQFGFVIGTDNPNLAAFRDGGGKAIVWHGWADQLIAAEGTVDYYTRVQQRMGGAENTSRFIRLFMAPGVAHCRGGAGPAPTGQLDALIAWVENGQAPETLLAQKRDQAGAVTRSRPLCQYPLVARYTGNGTTDAAANFVCSRTF